LSIIFHLECELCLIFSTFLEQAEVLRQGGAEVKIAFLELLDDKIGPRGALALGTSLSQSNNLSLLTLKLDYNSMLGLEGERKVK
jgi:hypothetical protein